MAVPPLLVGNEANGGAVSTTAALWISFALPVLVLLALDLGIFLKSPREPTVRESLAWAATWAALAAVFGIALGSTLGAHEALSFFTAYVVEQALSVDNLFVFLLVFGELAVPGPARKRALAWGVLGALVLRVVMLGAGASILARFHVLTWALGALLVFAGIRAAKKLLHDGSHATASAADSDSPSGESSSEKPRPDQSLAARLLDRWIPLHDRFDEDRFITEVGGRPYATPLLLAVITILFADVVFALDSIPAVLGISSSPIVVVTSNVFAVLSLRSMFFLVSALLSRLRYLPHGLAAVLIVVGGKMILGSVVEIPTWLSLLSVLAVLGVAVVVSLRSSLTPSPIPSASIQNKGNADAR